MRSGRSRIVIRCALIGVAIIGVLVIGIGAEIERQRDYQERINYHLQQLEGYPPSPSSGFFFQLTPETQSRQIKDWVYHASMWEKYKTAMKIPFYYLADEVHVD